MMASALFQSAASTLMLKIDRGVAARQRKIKSFLHLSAVACCLVIVSAESKIRVASYLLSHGRRMGGSC